MKDKHWLSILGIGEDGIAGMSGTARALLEAATLVVGGTRHLGLAGGLIAGETLAWPHPIDAGFPAILARRGQKVAVLASGDPMFHGVGSHLARLVEPGEFRCLPVASCVALAAAHLGWAVQDTGVVSCCGLPVARLIPHLHHGARLFVLSADAATPAEIAVLLVARGFGGSIVHVLEALGGPRARHRRFGAGERLPDDILALNLVAIEAVAGADARVLPRAAGLADAGFGHDGQITKSEVRAATLAALAPRPGDLLWDIGCGSGSVAIEWLLSHPANRAVALDRDPVRVERARANALSFGVPAMDVRMGEVSAGLAGLDLAGLGLAGLDPPDAVFIGGGAKVPGVIEACWAALRPGGRLVVNAVTIETEAALFASHREFGGNLTRISVERLDRIGRFHGFRPAMTVTQWLVVKP